MGHLDAERETVKPPQVGDNAINAELLDSEGRAVMLSTLWREKPVALVFLRHLGCTFCRQQLAWLRRDYARFAELGAEVVCVSQGDPKVGKAYVILFELPFPLLLTGDDLTIYRRYGLRRGRLAQLLNPVMLFKGIVSVLQGYKQTEVVGDAAQLGGAFVIDRGGAVRYAHRNRDAADNAPNEQILAVLRETR